MRRGYELSTPKTKKVGSNLGHNNIDDEISEKKSGVKDNEMGEMGKKRKENMNKPIKDIHIKHMDNGGYTVRADSDYSTPGKNSYESAHQSAHGAMKMVKDHMTSPHLPKMPTLKTKKMKAPRMMDAIPFKQTMY